MNFKPARAVIKCPSCNKKNRIAEPSIEGFSKCASCKQPLSSPFRYLVFDCETTGLPSSKSPPRLVQLAWSLYDATGHALSVNDFIVRPTEFVIPKAATSVHGISQEQAEITGVPLGEVLHKFLRDADNAGTRLIAHNISFDDRVITSELDGLKINSTFGERMRFCTMKNTVDICKLPTRGHGYKWPKLQELHMHLFGRGFSGGHNAKADVEATARCFFELRKQGLLQQ
jgi:DNA polymerase III, epsilon subunit and related 3''-5'' exonucleases